MSELLAMDISDDVRRRIIEEEADKSDRLPPHAEALRAADSLIVEGLRAKVRAIVDKPDLGTGDLLAIEQVARVGREMIAAGRNPGAIRLDGVPDAQFTQGFGAAVAGALGGLGVGIV